MQEKVKPDLEKIADLLQIEAQMTLDAGVFSSLDCLNKNDRLESRSNHKIDEKPAYLVSANDISTENSISKSRHIDKQCFYCGVANHKILACRDFARTPTAMRWKTVRKFRLCFKCLSVGHSALNCNFENCKLCKRKHNILLHYHEK